MNKLIFPLFIIVLILSSCTKNNDEPPGPQQPVVLTLDNIEGTWEVYYRTRSVNNGEALREPYIDGSRITYNRNGTFSEINIDGLTQDKGTFKIVGKDSIEVTITTKEGKRLKAGEEIREIHIIALTEKRMNRSNIYKVTSGNISNWVEEINIYRNIAKISSANETPDLPEALQKEIINIDILLGTWEIELDEIYYYSGNNSTPRREEDEASKGVKYRYYIENGINRYTEYKTGGGLESEGTFRIIDDVVHTFGAKSDGTPLNATIWLKNWRNNDNNFTMFDFRHLENKENKFFYEGYGKRYTYLKKIASE